MTRQDLTATFRHCKKPAVTLASSIEPTLAWLPRWREFLKIYLRAIAQPRVTRKWLALLNSHPVLSECIQHEPTAVRKIYRPYLTALLNTQQRLEVLTSHYSFMFNRGLAGLVVQACRNSIILTGIKGKTGVLYEIHLRAVGTCGREGELVMQLCIGRKVVYSTAFTFSSQNGMSIVCIGCVQGPRGFEAKAIIKEATRELYGLRAKALLVGVVQRLGHALGCTELRLVGNINRTSGPALKQGKVFADYENFWYELGAVRRTDGDFTLPCIALAPLVPENIIQKRRSEARKCQQMLETITAEVNSKFFLDWGTD